MRSLFQFGYTTLFGAYAIFLYLRTGSLLAVILVHAFCNWMGLPRFWGRVGAIEPLVGPDVGENDPSRKRDEAVKGTAADLKVADSLGIWWTIAYYILLMGGAVGFYKYLWTLTESPSALVKF